MGSNWPEVVSAWGAVKGQESKGAVASSSTAGGISEGWRCVEGHVSVKVPRGKEAQTGHCMKL